MRKKLKITKEFQHGQTVSTTTVEAKGDRYKLTASHSGDRVTVSADCLNDNAKSFKALHSGRSTNQEAIYSTIKNAGLW